MTDIEATGSVSSYRKPTREGNKSEKNFQEIEDLEKLRVVRREEEEKEWDSEDLECEKVMRELEMVKRELSKLKVDMASVKEERNQAAKETKESMLKREYYLSSAKALTKEIEGVNEESVLVELARVEAIKEYEEIEAKTRDQTEKHASAIEVSQMEKQNMIDEVEDAKEHGPILMIIMSEISTLKSELNQVKKQEEHTDGLDSATLLESVLKVGGNRKGIGTS